MVARRSRYFNRGFTIDETELRRLHETMTKRLKETGVDAIRERFIVSFKNKERREVPSLDELVKFENHGQFAIKAIEVECLSERTKTRGMPFLGDGPSITVTFSSSRYELISAFGSIEYVIKNFDSDQMHLTASNLDERITKMLNWSPLQFSSWWMVSITVPIMMLMTIMMLAPRESGLGNALTLLEQRLAHKEVIDPVEAMVMLERARMTRVNSPLASLPSTPVLVLLALLVVMIGVIVWLWKPHNFLIGDEIKRYEQRKNIRTVLSVTVVLSGILLPAFRKWLGW